jgi:hypothetical protein
MVYQIIVVNFRLTNKDIDLLDKWVGGFMKEYRKMFKTVPPKLHILEDHVISQLRKIQWSMGVVSEQGGESSHRLVKEIRQRYFGKSKDSSCVARAISKCTTDSLIKLRSECSF